MACENYISNPSHEVLFLLSDPVYTIFGSESFLKQVKLMFAYITQFHMNSF